MKASPVSYSRWLPMQRLNETACNSVTTCCTQSRVLIPLGALGAHTLISANSHIIRTAAKASEPRGQLGRSPPQCWNRGGESIFSLRKYLFAAAMIWYFADRAGYSQPENLRAEQQNLEWITPRSNNRSAGELTWRIQLASKLLDTTEEAYSVPPDPLPGVEGAYRPPPPKNPTPAQPFGLRAWVFRTSPRLASPPQWWFRSDATALLP